jgi:transmembrane sensor
MKPRADSHSRDRAVIEKAAADWIARCDRGLTPREAEAFARWENADPRHRAELARLSATWNALNTADEIPEVMDLARGLEEGPKRTVAGWRTTVITACGLAAALAMIAWLSGPGDSATSASSSPSVASAASYRVVASTARRLTLADGTIVELNGDSAVETAFTTERRLVRLVRGEANFTVVKDIHRPFVVQASNVAVQAVGTAFNVRLDPASVHVLVTEGRVRVDDVAEGKSLLSVPANRNPVAPGDKHAEDAAQPFPLLAAGERVSVPSGVSKPVAPSAVTAPELDRATGWNATQLVFERTSLREAVAAFNSFNQRQLALGDPALGQRKLGGTFRADNVDAFIRLLETGFEIRAETSGSGPTVLRAAR